MQGIQDWPEAWIFAAAASGKVCQHLGVQQHLTMVASGELLRESLPKKEALAGEKLDEFWDAEWTGLIHGLNNLNLNMSKCNRAACPCFVGRTSGTLEHWHACIFGTVPQTGVDPLDTLVTH